MKEAFSYWSSPGHLGLIAAGVSVWLPGQVATCCGQEFCFYVWSGDYSDSQGYMDDILELKDIR